MIHTRRGFGERVIESGEETLKTTDGGSGRGRKNSIIQKTTETGGAGRVSC